MIEERHHRTLLLLGETALDRLARAHVTIVGVGGVGSYVAEALARVGVGHLRLIDADHVARPDINRQLVALESTVGRPKTEVAAERARDINPNCVVEAIVKRVKRDTLEMALAPPIDGLVDAIDSLDDKIALIEAVVRRDVQLVSCMGAARRLDPFALRAADISATGVCPFARNVRRRLRALGIVSGVRCIYSTEPPKDAATATDRQSAILNGSLRPSLGSIPTLPGIVGLMAAQEMIAMLIAPKREST